MYNPERYRKGAPTVLDALYPFVGKTKYGYKTLTDEIAQRLKTMMQEICARYEMLIND
ncbi:hypothetical protein AGMMS49949_07220 [Alphaproteobacteria bacterium]|nr:hypothetical protein AGMMS49949_07220 [Alphaproteobacteria bacterium]GHS99603.1 hypothetical protein AGMMS50296_7820 [Alphaproteobacteria bacterium]